MAQQNIATLKSNINTQINDNTAGEISAADVRNNLINMTDSLLFNSGSQGITGSLDVSKTLSVTADAAEDQRAIIIYPSISGMAVVRHNRDTAADEGTYEFATGNDLVWAHGLRSLGDFNYHIYNHGLGTDAVTIDFLTGYVGVGTLTPSFSLDISGSGRFTENLITTGSIIVNGNSNLGNQLTDTTVISGSLTIMSNGVANSTAQALIIKNAIDSQDTGSIDITSTNNTQIPSIVLRNSDNTAILKITEYGTDSAQIDLSGGGTNNLFISAGGKLDFYAATIVISSTLPTTEPAVSGQLWLSGSAGTNSKVLCVRN